MTEESTAETKKGALKAFRSRLRRHERGSIVIDVSKHLSDGPGENSLILQEPTLDDVVEAEAEGKVVRRLFPDLTPSDAFKAALLARCLVSPEPDDLKDAQLTIGWLAANAQPCFYTALVAYFQKFSWINSLMDTAQEKKEISDDPSTDNPSVSASNTITDTPVN